MAIKTITVSPNSNIEWKLSRDRYNDLTGSLTDITKSQTIPAFLEASHGKLFTNEATTWYLLDNGELWGCGGNTNGQLGIGSTDSKIGTFKKAADNVRDFASASSMSWYINNNDELFGCGYNGNGEQGDGTTTKVTKFTKRAENVKKVVCSTYTTWYLTNDGQLFGCGKNDTGQQSSGDTNNVLTFTKRAENVKDVVCSAVNSVWYIDNNNDLYGCGQNSYGQQSSGDTNNVLTFTKRAENVKKVLSSTYVTWYIDNNDDLYGCGRGNEGQQGTGNTTTVTTFTKRAENVKDAAIAEDGGSMTWYIDNNNDLYGCGNGTRGGQGSNGTSNVTTFTKRAENVRYVRSSNNATLYIDQNNDLYMTGNNYYYQQGDGTSTDVKKFTKRAENVEEAYIYSNLSYYVLKNGDVKGAGNPSSQQFAQQQNGQGGTTSFSYFTMIVNIIHPDMKANFTINPTPSNAKVIINGETTKTVVASKGHLINYTVKDPMHVAQTHTTRIYEDTNINVELEPGIWKQSSDYKEDGVTYEYSNMTAGDFASTWANGFAGRILEASAYKWYERFLGSSNNSTPKYFKLKLPGKIFVKSIEVVMIYTDEMEYRIRRDGEDLFTQIVKGKGGLTSMTEEQATSVETYEDQKQVIEVNDIIDEIHLYKVTSYSGGYTAALKINT